MSFSDAQTGNQQNSSQNDSESAKLADYRAAMQEISQAASERKMSNLQRAKVVRVAQRAREAWDRIWQRLTPAISSYLKGESSEAMVKGLVELNDLTKAYSFDDSVMPLSRRQSWPHYENERDQIMAAVCLLVIGAWSELESGHQDAEKLIVELDGIPNRISIEHVGFVRDVIEAGGLPDCAQCGTRLTPREVGRWRCSDCTDGKRKTLGWLGIAIECKRKYGDQVYGDDLAVHFPEWKNWRRRLQSHFGQDRTDCQLWEDWIGFVHERIGVSMDQFLATTRKEADALLPQDPCDPAKRGVLNKGERLKITDVSGADIWEGSTEASRTSNDDKLPSRQRAGSPSRVKAKAAYDYALARISNANHMTAAELFDAVKDDQEVAELLPPNADTFRRYLNDSGIRLKKGGPKEVGGSIARESDLDRNRTE